MKDNASSNLRLCRLERLTPYRGVRKNLTRTVDAGFVSTDVAIKLTGEISLKLADFQFVAA